MNHLPYMEEINLITEKERGLRVANQWSVDQCVKNIRLYNQLALITIGCLKTMGWKNRQIYTMH